MDSLPSGTVTFLFTDIEGSTELWENHPEAMRTALARHDAILRNAIVEAQGVVFKTMGDGFCAAFAFPPDALAAAAHAQIAIEREPWPPSAALCVRMALHTGSAESRDNDYFGPALNRAGRLLSAAHGGQILLSAAVYELVRDSLPEAVGLRDLGLHRLKDLERPEQVFQVTHSGLTNDFPPLNTLDTIPNNLPRQLTSFIGREKQIADVTGLLAKTGLLTLTGSGGAGKTRLALQTAANVLDDYPGGAWLIELAPLSDPALVPQTVAQAVGIKEQAGQTITQTLTDYLKKERVLLVLDNCEHLASVCAPFTAALLRACPDVRVLATSRAPLGISGEQTFRVPSLSLPDPKAATATVQSLSQFEAVQLFIERAQAVKPDFTVTNQNAPSLAQLCCHLDGIPLALELAAARVRSLPVEDINHRLNRRFRLLTGGDRSALPRQQTLRALVDWSHDLLSEPEKVLFSRLSVFAGGWTLHAAEAICGFAPLSDGDVFDLLTSLVDKSLVVAEEDEGTARYRMGETLKQYAGEKQEERGETEALQNRHRDWFLVLGEEAEPKLRGPDQTMWLRLLESEHDNLRAALVWCFADANSANGGAAEEGLRLAGALWRLWYVRGYLGEGREYLSRALQKANGAVFADPIAAGLARAKVLNGAGNLAYVQGDYAVARSLFEESLVIHRPFQNKGCADALNNLGNVVGIQGDYAAAQSLYEESLAIYRKLPDKRGIADALNNLGNLAFAQGDYQAARTLLGECLVSYRALGHNQGIADALNNLGNVAYTEGDDTSARLLYDESLTIQRELGDKKGIANALNNLGHVVTNQRDFAAAQSLYEESLVLYRELGNKNGIAHSLESLAGVFSSGDPQKAVLLWGAAHALRESLGAPLPSSEQIKQNEQLGQARVVIGETAFAAAWQTGRAFSEEQAVSVALSVSTPPNVSHET